MKTFQSLEDVEFQLKKLDLERQITKEKLKRNYHTFQDDITHSFLSTTVVSVLSKFGLKYIRKIFN